ncbi:MAG: hypothetical protein QOD55_732 [Solirubrobacteraceae bacterium]|jgi:hypothetical protein|nr:hypothetical protein [Solirubrobacteraceae bacterium]MEA2288735.1 hypothetical protein [Solirubrobacteraceae bacterium]
MAAVVRVSVIGACAATRPALDALRAHARIERVSPTEYEAHVDGDRDTALSDLAGALDREVTPDWDEVVALSRPRAEAG